MSSRPSSPTKHSREASSSSQQSLKSVGLSRSKLRTSYPFTTNIKDYQIFKEICGVDDISFLYLAKHIPTDRIVSLKFTDLNLSAEYELLQELIKHAKNDRLCNHANIMHSYGFITEEERLWAVCPPIHYGTCRHVMATTYPNGFPEPVAASILKQTLKALIYLHENHMINNDIRADNILLDDQGQVHVSGLRQLAWLSRDGGYLKSVFSSVSDSVEWTAPEVLAQNSNFDEKVDIYSFGITALELAFNKTPFDDWPPLMILLNKLEYECPGIPHDGKRPLSPAFYAMVKCCLSKNPSQRPSARQLLEECVFFKSVKGSANVIKAALSKEEKTRSASPSQDSLPSLPKKSSGGGGVTEEWAGSDNSLWGENLQ